ncbi:MAG: hypothetical protein QXZ28_00285 [Candidatus Methanomethylicaceae archaeon]
MADIPGNAALLGDAHELIVAGILIRLGFEVGHLSAKGGAYDLWVIAFEDPSRTIKPLRVQVKTISKGKSVKFIGGVRAGVDREYKSEDMERIGEGNQKMSKILKQN